MESYTLIDQSKKKNIDFPCVPFCVERSKIEEPDFWHLHDFYQLTIVLTGTGTFSVNGLSFPIHTGNVYVVSSFSPHCLFNTQALELINILFWKDDLLKFAGTLKKHAGFQSLFMIPAVSAEANTVHNRILTLDYQANQDIERITTAILNEVRNKKLGSEILVQANFMILITMLSRLYEAQATFQPQRNEFFRLITYINQNYTHPIKNADLCNACRLSEHRIRELFFDEFHCTPMQYVLSVRFKHACYLLKYSEFNISQIASQTGFEDSNYFSRCFKKNFNISPTQFRRSRDN